MSQSPLLAPLAQPPITAGLDIPDSRSSESIDPVVWKACVSHARQCERQQIDLIPSCRL